MNLAIVGCGYISDAYLETMGRYPALQLIGAWDRNPANLNSFCARWKCRQYSSLNELTADPSICMVLNLTNPRSHFEVTKACLNAGKHVYSEKPLAMRPAEARELAELAATSVVQLSSAPCSLLGPTAQTMWKAVADGMVGKVRLVYANFDDGMIAPHQSPWLWTNERGVPWPAKDEFEIGCTYEHAGYVLTWMCAMFGPVAKVSSYSSCLLPEKGLPVREMAPDFSVGCLEFVNGVVARVTCGLVAPLDKSLTIVGDEGALFTNNVRDEACPVFFRSNRPTRLHGGLERRLNPIRAWLESLLPSVPWSGRAWHFQRRLPFVLQPISKYRGAHKSADFCRGPAELADAVSNFRPSRLSAQLGLHITELIEALQYSEQPNSTRSIESRFDPIQPVGWEKRN